MHRIGTSNFSFTSQASLLEVENTKVTSKLGSPFKLEWRSLDGLCAHGREQEAASLWGQLLRTYSGVLGSCEVDIFYLCVLSGSQCC